MSRVLVGPGRSIRSAMGGGGSGPWAGVATPYSCVWKGEEPTVLLRSALRSTAFGRRLPSGGPSIPLPPCAGEVPNVLRSLLLAQRLALRPSRRLLPRRTIVSLLRDGSMERNTITAR